MTPSIEGSIAIRIETDGGRVREVDIHSSRPVTGPRLFHGRAVDEVLRLVPAIYGVCKTAQSVAAVRACESALHKPADGIREAARGILVDLETARERFWRTLLGWPELLGEEPDTETVAAAGRLLERSRKALYPEGGVLMPGGEAVVLELDELASVVDELERLQEETVFSVPPAAWYGLADVKDLTDWSAHAQTVPGRLVRSLLERGWVDIGCSDIEPLPELDDTDLDARLAQSDADRFIARPEWDGAPRETSSYTRHRTHPLVVQLIEEHGNGLLTRVVAMLLDLADAPRRVGRGLAVLERCNDVMRARANDARLDAFGVGVAQLEAARGMLAHRMELVRGEVARYQILAPTEWNFHPEGVVARSLRHLTATDETELREQAELLITTIDPCVGYELEID